jgi:hypothetical protein
VTYYAAAERSEVSPSSGSRTFGDDLLRGGRDTSGSGEAMQMRSTTQGARNKKSIALPHCIGDPFSTTITESLASGLAKTATPRNKNWVSLD